MTGHARDDQSNERTRPSQPRIDANPASEPIHRSIGGALPLRAVDGVRQLVMFPPYKGAERAGAMVRYRHLLLEFETGQVFHLRLPIGWEPSPSAIARLANAFKTHYPSIQSQSDLAAAISWATEIALEVLDFDLSAPSTKSFPVRAAALERRHSTFGAGEAAQLIVDRVAFEEAKLEAALAADLELFINNLDSDVLALSPLWNGMPLQLYRWFVGVSAKVRTYRIQAARVFPAVIPILAGARSKSAAFSIAVSVAIDNGESMVDALAVSCDVRKATARHALRVPPELVAGEKLPTLITALEKSIPDRFPNEASDWTILERLVFDAIPKITGRPALAAINMSFLPAISRHGWNQAEKLLSSLCVGFGSSHLFREFLEAYKAVTWDLTNAETVNRTITQTACKKAVDEALASLGILRTFEAARSFPVLRNAAQAELTSRYQILRGERWSGIIDEPMVFGSCQIEPILSLSIMTCVGNSLNNCLASKWSGYAAACADGQMCVFAIRSIVGAGDLLGVMAIRWQADRYGRYSADTFERAGPNNTVINWQASGPIDQFKMWICTDEAQRRIIEFQRTSATQRPKSGSELQMRIEMETTIAALRKVRQKPLRFDVIRNKVLSLLNIPSSADSRGDHGLAALPNTANSSE